jgi:hypothetical protein
MSQEPQTVTIDGVEHDANTFSEQQILLLNHCIDLDRKINAAQFDLQQAQVGKDAFLKLLKATLVESE